MYCTFDSSQSSNQNTSQSNAAKTVLDAISNKQGKQQVSLTMYVFWIKLSCLYTKALVLIDATISLI